MALTKAKLMELIDNGGIDVGGGGGSGLPPGGVEGQILKKTATAADWGDITIADIKATRGNILHNWDFRNPVNQRGVTGAISTGTYFYDRWIRNSGTVTVAEGYLTLASGAVVEQRIEGLYLAGETATVSVQTDVEIISGTGVFPTAAGTVDITLTGFGTATLGYNAGYMFVRFAASGGQNVDVVKLELGTVSTLHLDPPVDHAVELPKCQRFYYRIAALSGGRSFGMSMSGSNKGDFNVLITHPVGMRIQPTITHNATVGNMLLRAFQGASQQAVDSILQVPNDENASSSVKFYRAGYTGFSVGQFFNIVASSSYIMDLSADL